MVGGQPVGFAMLDGMGSQHKLVGLAMEVVVERKSVQVRLQATE